MPAHVEACIDLAACRHNCRRLAKAAARRSLFAVVKADAYGHGMLRIAAAIKAEVQGLCVFRLEDGVRLRSEGIRLPILVLGGIDTDREVADAAANRLWLAVHQEDSVRRIVAAGAGIERVFIKVQTGMHRLGMSPAAVAAAVAALQAAGSGNVALLHHYAQAEAPGATAGQDRVMAELVASLGLPFSASNTAGTLMGDGHGEEFVRCGIGVYGCSPGPQTAGSAEELGLRPVMTLRSKVLAVHDLEAGDAVGYGARWRADGPSRIAVAGCGYANGYPRAMPDGTPVLAAGRAATLVGTVSMEMLAFLAEDAGIQVGSDVVLWGKGLSADVVARHAGTIAYELLASLPASVQRVYRQ